MMDIGALIKNPYVMWGGLGLLAVGAVVLFLPAAGDAGEGDPNDESLGMSLLPANSIGSLPAFTSTTGQASAEAAGLDALIGLETIKAGYGHEVALKEIDAALIMNNSNNETNLALGQAQADALNLSSFANIFESASSVLKGEKVGSVAGNFSYLGKTFSFSTLKTHTQSEASNNLTLNALAGYAGINSGALGYAPPASSSPGYTGGLSSAVGPRAISPSVPASLVAPAAASVASRGRSPSRAPTIDNR